MPGAGRWGSLRLLILQPENVCAPGAPERPLERGPQGAFLSAASIALTVWSSTISVFVVRGDVPPSNLSGAPPLAAFASLVRKRVPIRAARNPRRKRRPVCSRAVSENGRACCGGGRLRRSGLDGHRGSVLHRGAGAALPWQSWPWRAGPASLPSVFAGLRLRPWLRPWLRLRPDSPDDLRPQRNSSRGWCADDASPAPRRECPKTTQHSGEHRGRFRGVCGGRSWAVGVAPPEGPRRPLLLLRRALRARVEDPAQGPLLRGGRRRRPHAGLLR